MNSILTFSFYLLLISLFSCSIKSNEVQNKELNQIILAEIIFRAANGDNPLEISITSENINKVLPEIKEVEQVCSFFTKHGFKCYYFQSISATLQGSKQNFDQFFSEDLVYHNGAFYTKDKKKTLRIDQLPTEISRNIVTITLPEPIDLFHSNEEE